MVPWRRTGTRALWPSSRCAGIPKKRCPAPHWMEARSTVQQISGSSPNSFWTLVRSPDGLAPKRVWPELFCHILLTGVGFRSPWRPRYRYKARPPSPIPLRHSKNLSKAGMGDGIPPATASRPDHAPGVCRLRRSREGTMGDTQLIVSISTCRVGGGDRVRRHADCQPRGTVFHAGIGDREWNLGRRGAAIAHRSEQGAGSTPDLGTRQLRLRPASISKTEPTEPSKRKLASSHHARPLDGLHPSSPGRPTPTSVRLCWQTARSHAMSHCVFVGQETGPRKAVAETTGWEPHRCQIETKRSWELQAASWRWSRAPEGKGQPLASGIAALRSGCIGGIWCSSGARPRVKGAPRRHPPPGGQRWVALGSPRRYWYLGILTAPSEAAPLEEPQWF